MGQNWLVVIDAYTKYPCIHPSLSVYSKATIDLLEEDFAHFGYPYSFVSDNATSFTSNEFQSYCKERNIVHLTAILHGHGTIQDDRPKLGDVQIFMLHNVSFSFCVMYLFLCSGGVVYRQREPNPLLVALAFPFKFSCTRRFASSTAQTA